MVCVQVLTEFRRPLGLQLLGHGRHGNRIDLDVDLGDLILATGGAGVTCSALGLFKTPSVLTYDGTESV